MAVGKHAAIIKNTESGVQYLEMQSRYDDHNGWNPFENNPIYGTAEMVLRKRFGCRKTIDKMRMSSGDFVFKKKIILMDVESFKDNPDFAEILGYINTPMGEQQKGGAGGVK